LLCATLALPAAENRVVFVVGIDRCNNSDAPGKVRAFPALEAESWPKSADAK
jgi:hypothetical protein